jgi:hypothetical protein
VETTSSGACSLFGCEEADESFGSCDCSSFFGKDVRKGEARTI